MSNWERPTDGPGVVLWARVVPPVRHTAVRFHGGTGPAVVGVPADELVDQSPDLEELLPSRRVRSLLARVAAAPAATLQTWAAERLSVQSVDPLGLQLLGLATAGSSVTVMAEQARISVRQLHRRGLRNLATGPGG